MAHRNRPLAALFWLLASIAILFSGVTLWTHQTLLTAGGWGSLVGEVASEPEVIDGLSVVVVDRLSESIGVEDIVADVVPGNLGIVTTAITGRVERELANIVATLAATDRFGEAFVRANEAAHAATITAIRGGEGDALTSEAGSITLNVFPLVDAALRGLQDAGLISADRDLPELSGFEPSPVRVAALEALLGRDLPDDVGTITLVESERIAGAQTVIRWFDLITLASLLLAILCVLLALWLSERRLRMLQWLSAGAIAALLTGRVVGRLLLERITRQQEEDGAQVLMDAIVDAAVDSLMWFTFVLIALAAIVGVVAVLLERRRAGGRVAMETPPRTIGGWMADNRSTVLTVGLAVIVILALWSIGGADTALLVAAGIGLLLIAVRVLERTDKELAAPVAAPVAEQAAAPTVEQAEG